MRRSAPPGDPQGWVPVALGPGRGRARRRHRTGARRRLVVAGVAVAALAATAPGCSREEFKDRTAVVEVDGRSTTFDLVSCGLDETTAYVTGSSDAGDVLQAVVGVEERDLETGVPGFTGVTVSDGADERGAFGAGSWAARRKDGDPPGSILSARIRGARIQVSGRAVLLDATGNPTGVDGTGVPFALDARCDED